MVGARVLRFGVIAVAAFGALAEVAAAQRASVATAGAVRGVVAEGAARACIGVTRTPCGDARGALVARGDGPLSDAAERRRWAPVASLLLPGLGQELLHQDRFVAYLALEAWGVLEFANQRQEARRQQDRYRALAANVARALYGPTWPTGSGAYYESMEHYLESGVFDRVPGGDVDPDINADTYNGAMWLLARTTYWSDPNVAPSTESAEYRRAINFYLNRAVRAEYRWSWRNAQLEQDLYVRTIRRSNTAFREARNALGALLANHLLSSVDAFVTLRVEGLEGGESGGFAVRASIPIR
jgi:hypothetical protein